MELGFITNKNPKEKKLQIPCDFKHTLILGRTGTGKKASVITPLLIDRIEKNHGILIFDFKGNYHYIVKAIAKSKNKLQDVIELGKDYGYYTNIIEDLPSETLFKLINPLLGDDKIDKFWRDSAVQLGIPILTIIRYMNEYFNNNYIYPYNFKSLLDIASNAKDLMIFKYLVKQDINHILKHSQDYSKELNIVKIIADYYKNLDKIADNFSLSKLTKDNEKITLQSIMITLTNPIASLSKDNINIHEIDILEELTKGKIIIFSLNDFDYKVLNTIVTSIFYKIILFNNEL